MPKSLSFLRIPGGNPLFYDYIENFDRVRSFYSVDYREPIPNWKLGSAERATPRDDLIAGLMADAERWGSSKQTRKNIEKLRQPETLAVLAGQQVGLFGGPLFTYYKALSTVLWAKEIQKQTHRPTVPVFWMETSDHDFYEINHVRLLDLESEEVMLSLTHPPEQKRRIVGSIQLNGEIEKLIHRLWSLLPSNTYRGAQMELLTHCYRPGQTIADAFAEFFSHLFSEDGLVIFDAENARCKQGAGPLWDRILTSGAKLNQLLVETTQAVHKAGYPPQIQAQDDRLQLFLRVGDVRVPLSLDGNLLPDEEAPQKIGIRKLRLYAQERPQDFLPKVSLRPILQDFLFPTAAFVAGPSEIAYYAQLRPLYEALDVPMPAIIPRLSLTLIETKIEKILDKYSFSPERLRQGHQKLVNEILESAPGNDLPTIFGSIHHRLDELQRELTIGMIAIDPTLQHAVEKTCERCRQGLEVLEEKAKAALRQKNETTVQQIQKCCSHLAPGGHLQERRYNVVYYLARYGRSFASRIRAQADVHKFRHQLIYLGENE